MKAKASFLCAALLGAAFATTLPAQTSAFTYQGHLAYNGSPAAKELRRNIKALLLIQLAELDTRINESWPEYEVDLQAAGVKCTMHMYPQCNHGFHNDSTGRYDEKNANLAWERTMAFFKEQLG